MLSQCQSCVQRGLHRYLFLSVVLLVMFVVKIRISSHTTIEPLATTLSNSHNDIIISIGENPEDLLTNKFSFDFDRSTNMSLNTTLCAEKCFGDCRHYITPIKICYNGYTMFQKHGEDNPFGEHDVLDEPITIPKKTGIQIVGIKRIFYKSTNSTCSGGMTDSFDDIPVGTCVGPFGDPRPWGLLKIVHSLVGLE